MTTRTMPAIGDSIWSSKRVDHNDQPLGGVVVAIDDKVDPETGEVERYFTVVSPFAKDKTYRPAESEVTPEGIEATTTARLSMLLFNAALEIVKKGTRKSGLVPATLVSDSKVQDYVTRMYRYIGAAQGGRG